MGGIETMAAAIGADLAGRLPRQNKKQREGLALLVATALDVRDVNLMELAAALPRAAERLDMRYQWISRVLANPLIDTGEVMAPFAREVLARASAQAHTLVLIIDQSQVNATHQISVRWAATVCSSAATLPSNSITSAFSSVGESASRSPGGAILSENQRSARQGSEKRAAATSFAAGTCTQIKLLTNQQVGFEGADR